MDDDERVLRSYRRARTYPRTVRKLANVDLPYPVTVPQLALWLGVFFVLWYSRSLWMGLTGSMTIAVLLAVPTMSAILLRHLRLEGRSPIAMAAGFICLAIAPATGRLHGRALRVRNPRVYRLRIIVEEYP